MPELTRTEEYNLDGLWKRENSFFVQFEHVSLPLGGLTQADFVELYHLVAKNSYGTGMPSQGIKIADVGCWTGLSSLLFALIAKPLNGTVYSVDWFEGSEATNLDWAGKFFNIQRIFNTNIKQFDFGDAIKVVGKRTDEACKDFEDNSLDVVFLDADHRYKCVKRDIQDWLPKVKSGGLLCGHDCEFLLPKGSQSLYDYSEDKDIIEALHVGVMRALAEELPQARHTTTGKVWFYKKP